MWIGLVLALVVVFYLPWLSMYKFMQLAGYKNTWRAFVPGWNFLVMYDLANAGRGNVLWLLVGLLPALLIMVVAAFIEAGQGDGVAEGQTLSFDPAFVAAAVVATIVPACVLLTAVISRLAVNTGRKKSLGIIAGLPLVWVGGLPYLASTAKENTGMPPEYVPLPPLPSFDRITGRRS
jgi:hypothetical protein